MWWQKLDDTLPGKDTFGKQHCALKVIKNMIESLDQYNRDWDIDTQ